MTTRPLRPTRSMRIVAVVLAVVLAAGVAAGLLGGTSTRTAAVYFPEARSVYVGDDVQMLGVRIGEVTAITPEPGRVRIDIAYDADQPVPADAGAALIAPSLVTVRHVELAPAYQGGPQLADGATIPESRTAVPVEWDEVKTQLDRLATALGPQGANSDGALSRLLDTSAANLDGQGTNLNQTIRSLSEAMSTLAEGRGDFFATVRNLQVFVSALDQSDAQVRDFNQRLATVSGFLADDREELGTALTSLDRAFGDLTTFLEENRGALTQTVQDLQPMADVLADERQKLADVLHFAPHALSNFYGIYDPLSMSITGNLSVANLQDPAVFVCAALYNLGGSPQMCQSALGPLAKVIQQPPPPAGASVLERNGRANQVVNVPGPDNPRYTGDNDPDSGSDAGPSGISTDLVGVLEQEGNR